MLGFARRAHRRYCVGRAGIQIRFFAGNRCDKRTAGNRNARARFCLRSPEGYAFRDVNMEIRPGQRIAIVGPSGCGKTTLLKVLLGLLSPTEGQCWSTGATCATGTSRTGRNCAVMGRINFIGTIEDNVSFFDPDHDPARVRGCAAGASGCRNCQYADGLQHHRRGPWHVLIWRTKTARHAGPRSHRRPGLVFDETLDQIDTTQENRIRDAIASSSRPPWW